MTSRMSLSAIDKAKRAAVAACIEHNVHTGHIIGVGTGSTAKFVAPLLADKVKAGTLKNITCIPTSFQARHLINENGLQLSCLERNPVIDITIDGADELDQDLNCIKGGGGCLGLEKLTQSCSKRFLVVGDTTKQSQYLGEKFKKLPLEVLPAAYKPVQLRIEREMGGSCVLRMATQKAGPVVTDSGNYILDWHFTSENIIKTDWKATHIKLKLMTGMVETGLFIGVAEKAYLGNVDNPNAKVVELLPQNQTINGKL